MNRKRAPEAIVHQPAAQLYERFVEGIDARRVLTTRAVPVKSPRMASIGFTYWQDEEMWLGYLDQYPDYMTQGVSLDDLREHLLDLYNDLSSGLIPNVRQHSELELV
jgi:hypothetical protein